MVSASLPRRPGPCPICGLSWRAHP